MKNRSTYWWAFVVSISMWAIGYVGFAVASLLYPDSNPLGGLTLIFGPIVWLGSFVFITTLFVWIHKMEKGSAYWRLFVVSGSVWAVGEAGLAVGFRLYPDSNLLGGLALIFGPISWLGSCVFIVTLFVWSIHKIICWICAQKVDEQNKGGSMRAIGVAGLAVGFLLYPYSMLCFVPISWLGGFVFIVIPFVWSIHEIICWIRAPKADEQNKEGRG